MGPLVFFAFVIGIDLLFKSLKDKKKIEDIRERKMEELKKQPINQSSKVVSNQSSRQVEMNIQRENLEKRNQSLMGETNDFHGEGKAYRDEHEGYRDRYDDRYKSIQESYNADIEDESHSLYDRHAIKTSAKKEYKDLDIRDYGRERDKVDIPVPKASTLREDVLNGIIFAEILGKPRSLQKR